MNFIVIKSFPFSFFFFFWEYWLGTCSDSFNYDGEEGPVHQIAEASQMDFTNF